MSQYLPIFIMLVLAVAVRRRVVPRLPAARSAAGRRRPRRRRTSAASCPTASRPSAFPVRFYLVAMIFIIFDIEIIFLYPWAVIFRPNCEPFGLSRWWCSPSRSSCRSCT